MTTEELIKELMDWASLDERLVDNPSPEWLESHKLLHLAAARLRELHAENQRLRDAVSSQASAIREAETLLTAASQGEHGVEDKIEAFFNKLYILRRVLGEEGGAR